jgi:threonine/homoserine/homoserine lactone efflux protein
VIELIIKGVVTGLVLSVMLGPAFFLLLETSIRRGIRSALAFDGGVLFSDIIYIVVAYVFFQQVEELSEGADNALIRLIGGGLFILYGLITFFKKVESMQMGITSSNSFNASHYWVLFVKGLLLNLANPLVVFYWFSVMALGQSGAETVFTGWDMFLFITVILVTFFTIDIVKIIGAKRLRPFITTNLLKSLNQITGAILMIFGIFLVINSIIIWMR